MSRYHIKQNISLCFLNITIFFFNWSWRSKSDLRKWGHFKHVDWGFGLHVHAIPLCLIIRRDRDANFNTMLIYSARTEWLPWAGYWISPKGHSQNQHRHLPTLLKLLTQQLCLFQSSVTVLTRLSSGFKKETSFQGKFSSYYFLSKLIFSTLQLVHSY